jgi:hypothetical protein
MCSVLLVLGLCLTGPALGQSGRLIDVNTASMDELQTLPGVDDALAWKIVAGRPYRGTADLVVQKVLPQATYDRIAARLVAGGNAPLPAPTPLRTPRDMAELAAKHHPGEKWGYVTVYMDASDGVGDTLVIKVSNTAPDGALLTVPVSSGRMNAATHDLWTQVRGYVRRGQGEEGTDTFEVTDVWHRANPHLALMGVQEFAVEGWRVVHASIALTH